MKNLPLLPLFLISGVAVGFETALTRIFAVQQFSEYGYWVISIAMAGFALSGVAMAIARDAAIRHGTAWLRWLPALLILAAGFGLWAMAANRFNPLQLQNAATYAPQLWNIALYDLALLPFFFLAGCFVSLSFMLDAGHAGRVYAADLMGAGAGSAGVLALMYGLRPAMLMPALLPLLAVAALCLRGARLLPCTVALFALIGAEALLLRPQPLFNDYKPIYAPLHVAGSRVLREIRAPRGLYTLLDDFTERLDTDVSNDAGMLNLPGPPRAYGLYRDGNRIAALPRAPDAARYAPAALEALPYRLLQAPRVMIEGASGGFRPREALALGAERVEVIEPDPVIRRAIRHGLGGAPAVPMDPTGDARVRLLAISPLAVGRDAALRGYDLIDLSADLLDEGPGNELAFTVQALADDLRALAPGGIVSVPVSIRDFPAYALRMLATVRAALKAAGIGDPENHVILARSAWNVRILFGPQRWSPAQIVAARHFCDERSFDLSWYPGLDVIGARAGLYNDLPPVFFGTGQVAENGPDDAIADEAGAVLHGQPSASAADFDLAPTTLDQPAYYALLRLGHLPTLLRRLEILPQPEIAPLVNLAVLAQAVVLAVIVLALPLAAPALRRRADRRRVLVLAPTLYFAALGLGFLFIEMALIAAAGLALADRTSGFALVLTAMLVFSGLGSWLADRLPAARAPRYMALAMTGIVLWCIGARWGLQPLILHALLWPLAGRVALLLAVVAPVSIVLGFPFPLGLSRLPSNGLLPWAWGLNGAFSVVATPLANLVALQAGWGWVLLAAAILYGIGLGAALGEGRLAKWRISQIS